MGLAPKPYDILWPVNKRLDPYTPAPQAKVVELVGKPVNMLSFPASRAFFYLFLLRCMNEVEGVNSVRVVL